MKIYTRTGDGGQTSLYGGKRVLKSDLRIEAYGSVDELNSVVGVVITESQKNKTTKILFERSENFSLRSKNNLISFEEVLLEIQGDLLLIGSLLAGYKISSIKYQVLSSKKLENLIDNLEKGLPELRNFILPGGSRTGSLLHLARTICRRAERRVVELNQKETIDKNIIIYLNRLSDLLFVMARFVNKEEGIKEIVWKI
ncbi:cob(I)yrinic acid a,c-diamide adenosyltransferase [Candidatus Gottesmanbacteria bacterium]|nr:cob(I)yrinic acid a,c-diamide adenosyltransferase [Candidatus Gottesmanbacteria bacterium]